MSAFRTEMRGGVAIVTFDLPNEPVNKISSAVGCGCCRCFMPAPQPVACAPACPPPVQSCDPCSAAPVTYGTAPMGTFAPAPTW